jgi:hypothetical protein
MTELVKYDQLNEAKSILSTIVETIYHHDKYQDFLEELNDSDAKGSTKKLENIKKTFINIRVFGSTIQPLFLANDIGIIIGASNVKNMIKNYNSDEKITGLIQGNNKDIKKEFLTKFGIYRLLLTSRTNLSDVFRGVIYRLIDHMWLNEIDTLKKIASKFEQEHAELVNAASEDLVSNVKKYRRMYEQEKKDRIEMETLVDFGEMHIEQLKVDKSQMLDRLNGRYYDEQLDESNVALDVIKKRFLKEFTISLVHPSVLDEVFDQNKKKPYDISDEYYSLSSYKESYSLIVKTFRKKSIINMEEEYYLSFEYNTKNKTALEHKPLPDFFDKKDFNDNIPEIERYVPVAIDHVFDKATFTKFINLLNKEGCVFQIESGKKAVHNLVFRSSLANINMITRDLIIEDVQLD